MKKKILWFVVVLSVLAFAFLFQDIPVHKQNDSIAIISGGRNSTRTQKKNIEKIQ